MRNHPAEEQGLTLTEVMVVVVLATVLMVGMTGFYMSSQTTWLDSSVHAITQREATLIVETIRDSTHKSTSVIVDATDPLHHRISLIDASATVWHEFWWDDTDSLIHHGRPGDPPRGPIGGSIVQRFQATANDSLLSLDMLELRTSSGSTVRTSSSFAILSR